MSENFTSKAEIHIDATPERVWQALTDPAIVKQYLFGTDMTVSDWQVGGKISYKGVWEGKSYEDKGEILELIPGQKLVSTYWSGMSGLPDKPENYQTVSYEIIPDGMASNLVVTQMNAKSQQSADHSGENWKIVLMKMKEILENN